MTSTREHAAKLLQSLPSRMYENRLWWEVFIEHFILTSGITYPELHPTSKYYVLRMPDAYLHMMNEYVDLIDGGYLREIREVCDRKHCGPAHSHSVSKAAGADGIDVLCELKGYPKRDGRSNAYTRPVTVHCLLHLIDCALKAQEQEFLEHWPSHELTIEDFMAAPGADA